MLISDGMSIYSIAGELNGRAIGYHGGSRWTHYTVAEVLTQPKYAGFNAFGRTISRLYTPTVTLPRSEWILTQGAFEPIVDQATFLQAQQILADRTINKSDEELLNSLRSLLAKEGRLSLRLVKTRQPCASSDAYRARSDAHVRSDVNFAASTVRVSHQPDRGWTPKAYKEREIPIPSKLVKKLQARKAKADKACGIVFPTAGCNPKLDFLDCLKTWCGAREA